MPKALRTITPHQGTVLERIAAALGADLVTRDASGAAQLDRRATAALVFDDKEALARLNAIVHPWVRLRSAELERELAGSTRPPPVIVFDIPLLYENWLDAGLDAVVVVTAPLATRVARVVERSGAEQGEADAVRADIAAARERGITGVPAFVVNDQALIPGAQDVETFVAALNRLRERAAS